MLKRFGCLVIVVALLFALASVGLADEASAVNVAVMGMSKDNVDALILVSMTGNDARMLMVDPQSLKLDSDHDPEAVLKAINAFYGLTIEKYALIPFDGLADIIDAAGGVDLEIAEDDLAVILPDGRKAFAVAGEQPVSNEQVRALLSSGSEKQRSERRRVIFEAMLDRARSGGLNLNILTMAKLMTMCETNFSLWEVMSLGFGVLTGGRMSITTKKAPLTDDARGESEAEAARAYFAA